jgi:glycerol-3-phosphate dehydrogenase
VVKAVSELILKPGDSTDRFDIAVIGGGVVGTAIARALARYRWRIALLEKHAELSFGTSKANSGIVHAGFHSKPGTLKADLCVKGALMYPDIASELDVEYKQNGVIMIAMSESEVDELRRYLRQGEANGVPDMRLIEGDELRALEPNLTDRVVAGILAPTGGVVSPFELTLAQGENAAANGVSVLLEAEVTGMEVRDRSIVQINTSTGSISARIVINAAGLFADKVANMAGDHSFVIHPRKGEEYLLDKRLAGIVHSTIFPLPTPVSKGILVIPTVHGNLMLGPTAEETEDRQDLSTTPEGFRQIFAMCTTMVNGLQPSDLIATFAGLRPASDREDFVIEPSSVARNLINVGGIESPGLTAAPAIAEMVLGIVKDMASELGLEISENDQYDPTRPGVRRYRYMTNEQRAEAIKEDPLFARVVCRCELVTEAEIVDAIRRGARTLDGVKLRTRAGMGRCQGGFCTSRIMKILSNELGIPMTAITKRGGASRILLHRIKDLLDPATLDEDGFTGRSAGAPARRPAGALGNPDAASRTPGGDDTL